MENKGKIKIAAVVGCTASGKTALAIELAKRLNGEIVCCDSMQIYKGMDIGTAKSTLEEQAMVKHHLMDFLEPHEVYSCADYARDARIIVEEISSRGKLPVFCGGTGLYLDRFLRGGSCDEAVCDEDYRRELIGISMTEGGIDKLHFMLCELDPECAATVHKNNVKRVIRALEIIRATGRKKSDVDKDNSKMSEDYDVTVLYPFYTNRDILYSRIEKRVDNMMREGLISETLSLYNNGVFESSPTASAAIGYKELLPYIRGEKSLDACVEDLKTATRRYAKRQMTWFNQKEYAQKVYMDDENGIKTFEEIVNICEKLFHKL